MLRDISQKAPKRVLKEHFGTQDNGFEVELQVVSRPDMSDMRRRVYKKVADRKSPTGYREEADPEAFRVWLRDVAIVTWRGLTTRMALEMCNRSTDGIDTETLDKELPFEAVDPGTGKRHRDNAMFMLEEARGHVSLVDQESGITREDVMSFEDFVFLKVTTLADARTAEEVREKNDSGNTSEGSSSS